MHRELRALVFAMCFHRHGASFLAVNCQLSTVNRLPVEAMSRGFSLGQWWTKVVTGPASARQPSTPPCVECKNGATTMHKRILALLTCLFVISIVQTSSFASDDRDTWRARLRERGTDKSIRSPGDHVRTLMHEGRKRQYLVHV